MTSLAAEACLGPEKYTVVSAGIDELVEAVRAVGSCTEGQQLQVEAVGATDVGADRQPKTMLKNPPKSNSKGRPKEKVERKKSIVSQAREKLLKKKGTAKKKTQRGKGKPCSYCHEDGHTVQTCSYMARAEAVVKALKDTELKL
ncbi:unnamed protein product [Urochloa humidicola]